MSRDVLTVPYSGPAMVRCRATVKRTGKQCRKWAIKGATVCRFHGGAAPQVRKKAAERIEASLDRAAIAVVRLMEDAKTPHAVKLAAAKDLLDRGGLTANHRVEDKGEAPWQVLLQQIVVTDERPIDISSMTIVVEPEPPPTPSTSAVFIAPPAATFDDTPPSRLDPEGLGRGGRGTKFMP